MKTLINHLSTLHRDLGIPDDYAATRGLSLQMEARILTPLGIDLLGRDQFATPEAAASFFAMQNAAQQDGITLELVSAFRSLSYQAGLIRRKLKQGQAIATILQASAAPGYSEHHTGRAFDFSTPGSDMLEPCFENTSAFAWLGEHGHRFGFQMSYGRDNPHGILYEPWHWCFQIGHSVSATEEASLYSTPTPESKPT